MFNLRCSKEYHTSETIFKVGDHLGDRLLGPSSPPRANKHISRKSLGKYTLLGSKKLKVLN